MTYQIHITQQAEQDIDEAATYIRSTLLNPSAAFRLLSKTQEVIRSLEANPKRHPLVDDPALSAWGIRYVEINHYLAFYLVSEEDHTVHIIRFLYGKRNWMHILKEESPQR